MTIDVLLHALQNSPLGMAIGGGPWLFPAIETLHVLGLASVFGSILMVDLRLLGISARGSMVSALMREVLPYTWIAFGVAAVSGTLMFISKAPVYFHNLQFRLKVMFLVLAGINMLAFHLGKYRSVHDWDRSLPPPWLARIAGALSILLWLTVIALGRWIGFTT
jgi:hypothetical protein